MEDKQKMLEIWQGKLPPSDKSILQLMEEEQKQESLRQQYPRQMEEISAWVRNPQFPKNPPPDAHQWWKQAQQDNLPQSQQNNQPKP